MQASLLTNLLLPLALGIIMLGLGLGLTLDDFRRVARYPRAVLIGLALQTLVLPWVAFGLALGFGLPVHPQPGHMLDGELAHRVVIVRQQLALFVEHAKRGVPVHMRTAGYQDQIDASRLHRKRFQQVPRAHDVADVDLADVGVRHVRDAR